MGGVQMNITRRIHASSLLEVVISMVIIVVVFGLAMMIIANIAKGSLSTKKIHAQAILKNVLADEERQRDLTSKIIIIDSVRVEQEVKSYVSPGLMEVQLTAYDSNGEKMAELRKIVISNDE